MFKTSLQTQGFDTAGRLRTDLLVWQACAPQTQRLSLGKLFRTCVLGTTDTTCAKHVLEDIPPLPSRTRISLFGFFCAWSFIKQNSIVVARIAAEKIAKAMGVAQTRMARIFLIQPAMELHTT